MTTNLSDYDYELPKELIAQVPMQHRADARLMVVDRAAQTIQHRHVRELPEILRSGDMLVLNNTRVVPARLVGHRTATGGYWEGLFLQVEAYGQSGEQAFWRILSKTRGKLQPNETVTLYTRRKEPDVELLLVAKDETDGSWIVRPQSDECNWDILDRVGRVPLPPYIRKGQMVDEDCETYQTVFAEEPGAVAAPTAGLHFTRPLLDKLQSNGVQVGYVTLHVGIGTFRPIESESIEQHEMHAEWARIDRETVDRITQAKANGGRIVAVGTTAVRTLETAASTGTLEPTSGNTKLYIHPPYKFKAVDVMMTNFHLPKTSLLVLVRTFGGDALLRRAYEEAIAEEYRFFSYGDSMLIL